MTEMREVVLDGRLGGPDATPEILEALGDAVMEALVARAGVVDPFVYLDTDTPEMRIELFVEAATDADALHEGVRVITEVLSSVGVEPRVEMRGPSAHVSDGEAVPA